jgi:hypothetical protein
MWPDRRLIDLFKIDHPIVLSPMAGLGPVGLAASVCDAGGRLFRCRWANRDVIRAGLCRDRRLLAVALRQCEDFDAGRCHADRMFELRRQRVAAVTGPAVGQVLTCGLAAWRKRAWAINSEFQNSA